MSNIRYRVVQGDTLWIIARRFKTTVDELARINNISDIHNIKVFQTLEIPKARSASGDAARQQRHRVRAGESLATIAQSYDISVETLAQANGLLSNQPAPFGRKLKIPATAKAPLPAPQDTATPPRGPSSDMARSELSMGALLRRKGTPVMALGRVSNTEGVNFRTSPDTNGLVKERLPFNTRLFVSHELPGDWYFVVLENKRIGYVYAKHINIHMPEPGAFLHKIRADESALQIVKQYYKGNAIRWGQDERYYVNVLVEANHGPEPRGIYNPAAGSDWSQTRTRENHLIWIPSLDFASQLKAKISSGSISHEAWKKTKHAAEVVTDFSLGSAAFVAGIIHGALESVWDLLAGLVDLVELAGKVIWSAITLELIDDLKELWRLVKAINGQELLKAGLRVFLERWDDPDLMKRWNFRGWMVGYTIAEIILLFCDGVVVLKWIGKTGKFGKLLEKFPAVTKTLKKAQEAWKSVPAAARKTLAGILSAAGSESLLKYEKLAKRIKETYALAAFKEIVTRGRQLAMKDWQILDFIEMGAIAKAWKKKAALTLEELLQQMKTWSKVIKPRGYPFLFESLEQFKQFQLKLQKLAQKYNLPQGKFIVQGSALRSALAKDIDVAILIAEELFEAYAVKCIEGIRKRAKNPDAAAKIINDLEKTTGEGFLPQFYFERLPESPKVSFQSELYDVLAGTFKKEVDVSLMKASSKLNLYPYLEFLPAATSKANIFSKLGTRPLVLLGVIHQAKSLPMIIKYYQGFAVDSSREVTPEKARQLKQYAKAFSGAAGRLDKVELYNQGRIYSVDYYGDRAIDDIKNSHQEYSGLPFTHHHALGKVGSFGWERIQSFDAAGQPDSVTVVLQDIRHHGWMEVQRDMSAQVSGIMKYHWEDSNTLRYVFEYDSGGALVSIYDVVHSERASFQEIKTELVDAHFFETGFTLPRELKNTAIPR